MSNLLSIVVPCFNEYTSLPELFQKAKYITENYPIEIILVNNGSCDDSNKLFSSLNTSKKLKKVYVKVNEGYGFGIKKGLEICTGNYLGWTHSDLQTDLFDLIRAYFLIDSIHRDRSKSVRFFIKGRRYARPLFDTSVSKLMGFFTNILFLSNKYDEINAQPSIFPDSMKDNLIKNAPDNYFFDIYAYVFAMKLGYRYFKMPVLFTKRKFGKSHWNINKLAKVKFMYKNIIYIIKIWFKVIFNSGSIN